MAIEVSNDEAVGPANEDAVLARHGGVRNGQMILRVAPDAERIGCNGARRSGMRSGDHQESRVHRIFTFWIQDSPGGTTTRPRAPWQVSAAAPQLCDISISCAEEPASFGFGAARALSTPYPQDKNLGKQREILLSLIHI